MKRVMQKIVALCFVCTGVLSLQGMQPLGLGEQWFSSVNIPLPEEQQDKQSKNTTQEGLTGGQLLAIGAIGAGVGLVSYFWPRMVARAKEYWAPKKEPNKTQSVRTQQTKTAQALELATRKFLIEAVKNGKANKLLEFFGRIDTLKHIDQVFGLFGLYGTPLVAGAKKYGAQAPIQLLEKELVSIELLIEMIDKGETDEALKRIEELKDIDQVTESYGTPLFLATKEGDKAVVEALVSRGANVNFIDRTGKDVYVVTVLAAAVSGKHLDIVRYLLKNGARQSILQPCKVFAWNRGVVPLAVLQGAILTGSFDMVKVLIEGAGIHKEALLNPEDSTLSPWLVVPEMPATDEVAVKTLNYLVAQGAKPPRGKQLEELIKRAKKNEQDAIQEWFEQVSKEQKLESKKLESSTKD
jgi:hypothetical protein